MKPIPFFKQFAAIFLLGTTAGVAQVSQDAAEKTVRDHAARFTEAFNKKRKQQESRPFGPRTGLGRSRDQASESKGGKRFRRAVNPISRRIPMRFCSWN